MIPSGESEPSPGSPCGLGRRLLAISYDSLLLGSVLILGTFALLPFTGGQAIPHGTWMYDIYLLSLGFAYFAWPWTHGGQTLGMRAWRIRLTRADGGVPGWRHAATRFFTAIISWLLLGLGFAWSIRDRDHRALHDLASGTILRRETAARI